MPVPPGPGWAPMPVSLCRWAMDTSACRPAPTSLAHVGVFSAPTGRHASDRDTDSRLSPSLPHAHVAYVPAGRRPSRPPSARASAARRVKRPGAPGGRSRAACPTAALPTWRWLSGALTSDVIILPAEAKRAPRRPARVVNHSILNSTHRELYSFGFSLVDHAFF